MKTGSFQGAHPPFSLQVRNYHTTDEATQSLRRDQTSFLEKAGLENLSGPYFILIVEIQTYRQDLLSWYTYSVSVRETWDLFFPPLPIPVLCWARHREIRSAGLTVPEHRHFMRKSANEGGSETGSYCHFISVPLPTTTTAKQPSQWVTGTTQFQQSD